MLSRLWAWIKHLIKLALVVLHQANIPLTVNDHNILKLKHSNAGQRCFIIGNGPSLKIADLDKLKNEITFACNRIFLAYEHTDWRPTYMFVGDSVFMTQEKDRIPICKHPQLFIAHFLRRFIPDCSQAIYYTVLDDITGLPAMKFSHNMLKGAYCGGTVLYVCLQMAYYMGFKEVYLLGVDFNYQIPEHITAKKGEPIDVTTEQNHFLPNYQQPGDCYKMIDAESQRQHYMDAKKFAEQHNFKIFNATRGGKLDVFTRVNFDSLFPV